MTVPRQTYIIKAVHCPHCGANPGKPCRDNSGGRRPVEHAERGRLAYALTFPMDAPQGDRVAAEKYRLKHPGVQVGAIVCAPSRAQALWYGLPYNQRLYESEHGPDTGVEGSDENACSHPLCRTATTPVATCGCACAGANHGRDGNTVEEDVTEYVGESVDDLLAKLDVKVKPKQEDTVSRLTKRHVERNKKKD